MSAVVTANGNEGPATQEYVYKIFGENEDGSPTWVVLGNERDFEKAKGILDKAGFSYGTMRILKARYAITLRVSKVSFDGKSPVNFAHSFRRAYESEWHNLGMVEYGDPKVQSLVSGLRLADTSKSNGCVYFHFAQA